MCELGFVEGATVRMIRYAPFGDPLEVEIGGCHLSLRKSEAAGIEVLVPGVHEPACDLL